MISIITIIILLVLLLLLVINSKRNICSYYRPHARHCLYRILKSYPHPLASQKAPCVPIVSINKTYELTQLSDLPMCGGSFPIFYTNSVMHAIFSHYFLKIWTIELYELNQLISTVELYDLNYRALCIEL